MYLTQPILICHNGNRGEDLMRKLRVLPVNVRRALLDDNPEAVVELARHGGRATASRRRQAAAEMRAKMADARSIAIQAHEDICPVDD